LELGGILGAEFLNLLLRAGLRGLNLGAALVADRLNLALVRLSFARGDKTLRE